jgi:acetyl esterase/lipase
MLTKPGGGFSLGSAHFYLEFLMLWHTLLLQAGYQNPAVFSLEYTLVPEGVYPKQVNEVLQGYNHVLDVAKDPSKVFVGGDSAGGTLTLSLLQELGAQGSRQKLKSARPDPRGSLGDQRPLGLPLPRMAILISPWVTLRSNLHSASRVDYLNRETAWKYAHEYAGEPMINRYPASPGSCTDDNIWRQSSPEGGIYVIYGEEEVFAPDIESFLKRQERHGLQVRAERIEGGIHAWPVASLLASNTNERRLYGLRCIVNEMKRRTVGQVGVQRRRAKKSD